MDTLTRYNGLTKENSNHPPPSTSPPPFPIHYVDSSNKLDELVRDCKNARRVALDSEADSLHHYFEKVCLIQVSIDENPRHFIVDPLASFDLEPFFNSLADKPLVFHGADYDLRMLRASFGFRPGAPVFDTMLAAQLLGYEEIGLAALVKRFFDVELPKHGQKYNWSRRPLPENLLVYAANDTRYLEGLVRKLEAELDRLGRSAWHREACERAVEASALTNSRDPERVWRVKGVGQLKDLELAVLKRLWRWRDGMAQKADRPPFMVLNNQAMIALTQWAVANPGKDLRDGPKLPRNFRGRCLTTLEKALKSGLDTPKSDWPPRKPPSNKTSPAARPDEKLVERLRAARDPIAKELDLPPSVVATRAYLVSLAVNRPGSVEAMVDDCRMMRWQAELTAEAFLKVIEKSV